MSDLIARAINWAGDVAGEYSDEGEWIDDKLAIDGCRLLAAELGDANVKRLQFREAATTHAILEDIASKIMRLALSRLTAQPLPDGMKEIADLKDNVAAKARHIGEQAAEIERQQQAIGWAAGINAGLRARIAELETGLEKTCAALEFSGHAGDDPAICEACEAYDEARALLTKTEQK